MARYVVTITTTADAIYVDVTKNNTLICEIDFELDEEVEFIEFMRDLAVSILSENHDNEDSEGEEEGC